MLYLYKKLRNIHKIHYLETQHKLRKHQKQLLNLMENEQV